MSVLYIEPVYIANRMSNKIGIILEMLMDKLPCGTDSRWHRRIFTRPYLHGINAVASLRTNGRHILTSEYFLRRLVFLRQAYVTKGAQQVSFRLVWPKDHARMGCLDHFGVIHM